MTKIEEIKDRIIADGGYTDYEECIDQCMKEYAEYYAKKYLVEAAKNVRMLDDGRNTEQAYVVIDAYDHFKRDKEFRIDIDSILTTKLPEHV